MDENLREIALGLIAAALTAAAGWLARSSLWRRRLHRRQRFFGMPENSSCLLVVNRDPGVEEWKVAPDDVFALLELSGIIKDCGARADIVGHDTTRQGFGERTEFCLGGPASNRRTAAHLQSLLPGVSVVMEGEAPGVFAIGSERYRAEKGTVEHVLLARLTGNQDGPGARPVFLICGQRPVDNQAAARYLVRHHAKLARKHGRNGTFCLLLKVVNSRAYGPDVVELVADVTRAATAPAAE
ncbi:hypothetical protein [Streptomyces sp. NPDC007083]|uniref:hypothetical protein n=1 Tax=unclassified Streptomyces TaxID=2593676 RepID=UPI0033FA161E